MLTGNVLSLNKEYEYRIFISLLSIINKIATINQNVATKKLKNNCIVVTGN